MKLETSNDNINSVYQTQYYNQQPTSYLEQRKKAMATPITTILTWCGITILAQMTRIMNKLLIVPEGIRNLNNESTKEMIATFRDYGHRDVADGKIIINRVQQKCKISLKD